MTESAIEEFLRYDGPVDHTTPRYAAEDVEINGHHIKRGTAVIVSLSAVNRDPRRFGKNWRN
jgi:cytochrome P450